MRKQQPTKRTGSGKPKSARSNLTFRMNVLFFSIFILFSALIFRLGYLQIVKGEDYVRALEQTEEISVNTSVARGRIYDSMGRILVDNQPENAITYTKMPSTKRDEMLEIASKLAVLIDMPTDKVTLRDKQDFWIAQNREEAYGRVSKKEQDAIRKDNPKMEESEFNAAVDQLVRDRITDADLLTLEGDQLEILAIFREMLTGYALSPQIVKGENVSDEEFARVSERLTELPGVNTTTDWRRVKLSSLAILGRTTVPSKGIPKSKLYYYLARDYSRNDRVGESYVEAQYEDLLQGQKAVVKNVTNKAGQVVDMVTTFEGEPGKELVLTIDSELNAAADEILEKHLLRLKSYSYSHLLDRAFLVMMNPNTGEVLSMVGKKIERDEETGRNYIVDYSYGAFTTAYEVGSTMKGATILSGYTDGVISPNKVLVDEPIYLAGTKVKRSLFNQSGRYAINDITALERSSNVYMFKIAMLMAGRSYYRGMGFAVDPAVFQKMRNYYAQFGLGVPTGIDLPNETSGVQGPTHQSGKVLDLAIGQFDTYTPMQMVQYISTIANGGKRVQPHVVKEIREPSPDGETLGPLVSEVETKVLNYIDNTPAEIAQVKEGMRRVYRGTNGSARKIFADAPYEAAGKTGTAEVVYYDSKREYWGSGAISIAHVGFSPIDNPEVAFAVMIPWVTTVYNPAMTNASEIGREVLDKYYEIKARNVATDMANEKGQPKILPAYSDDLIQETEEEQTVR
ncbi:penicillin-binding transpeptidase domain-containing protein [Caryophanon latum]|uniref:Penicillin-binding protein n=1 Tax=Caryophanon latum TaxID=33977 RepID=A0A1C0YU38_9BACL|nr:penicillin-binding protein [Caryophanon latum]